jgi:hypothetical protein
MINHHHPPILSAISEKPKVHSASVQARIALSANHLLTVEPG